MKYILGKKEGMTTVITEEGKMIPVTVITAGPCVVTSVKNEEKDGYRALQIGFDEKKKQNKPTSGHLKNSGKSPRYLREIRLEADSDLKVGDMMDVSIFEKGDIVDIAGTTKGHGFTGVVKKYGFKGWPGSHGHPHQRRPGSISASSSPSRVFKGKKMPGRYGGIRKSILRMEIIEADKTNNTLIVKGSVPGIRGSLLEVRGTKN